MWVRDGGELGAESAEDGGLGEKKVEYDIEAFGV